MDSSVGIGTNHQPGAQNEPFFDLLPPTVSSVSTFTQNPTQNSTRKMENNSGEFDFGGGDNVLPSFDFQPIRSSGAPSSKTSNASAGRMEDSGSRQASPPSSYSPYEPMVRRSRDPPTYEAPIPRSQELEKESFETATVAAVERTMKKYADNLLRVLEGLTGRLSQLESSTQRLEHLYGEIRGAVVNDHGETDGKLRSLENHILEVQRGVQLLRDRQELAEAQSQLAKLQAVTKPEPAPVGRNGRRRTGGGAPSAPPPVADQLPELTRAPSGKALTMEAPQQQISTVASSSQYQQPQQQLQLPSIPSMPSHSAPESLPPQQPQVPQQQPQQPSEFPLQSFHQQQQQQQQPPPPPLPSQQITHPQQHPPPPPPPGQMPIQSFYSQQQQPPPQSQVPPPPMATYGHQPEAPPYTQHPQGPHHVPPPPQGYSPEIPSYSYGPPGPVPQPQRQPSQIPPSSHIQTQHMYDPSMTRTGSGQLALPPPYLPQASQVSSSSMYDPQSPGSGYPSSSYRVAQPVVPSAPAGGGGGGYPRLPVAQPLPHALPPSGGSSGGPPGTPPLSTNRVPIDEVIEKVTQMGFSKDQVRAVVRRLTENGQSVDLNIVLDKLMNGGDAQQPPKGWFGR